MTAGISKYIEDLPWPEIHALYQEHSIPVQTIADKYDIAPQTVRNHVKRAGIDLRQWGGPGCRAYRDNKGWPVRVCPICGQEFKAQPQTKTCSVACGHRRDVANRPKTIRLMGPTPEESFAPATTSARKETLTR